ncbi:MAG: hypothetical protein JWN60_1440 [Acidobacteria bacterium]|nr:hypothetical protein [Acidobacteriota bacterium]
MLCNIEVLIVSYLKIILTFNLHEENMKLSLSLFFLFTLFLFTFAAEAQKRKLAPKAKFTPKSQPSETIGSAGVVIDESLAVLRARPSLFADSIQRMRRGRKVRIIDEREADGVLFFRVSAPPKNSGWVQSEAVFGKFRRGDDQRLARLVQASSGFDQLEIAAGFLEIYPDSLLRPAILLLFGDLAEETALRLSRDATRRLQRREMAASGAPLHSFYLNFVSLDRYRKLGIVFLFNSNTKNYHYEGASWREITAKYPKSTEAAEARKRLDSLKEKLEKRDAK